MALPQAVIEQEEEAQRLYAEMYGKKDEGEKTEDSEEAKAPAEDSATETPPAEKVEEQPAEAKDIVEPEAKEETPKPDAEYERLVQAHKVLQGKYNAEVPRQLDRIRELEAKIAALEVRQSEPKPKVDIAPKVDEDAEKVSAAIERDFGKDAAGNFDLMVEMRAKKIAEEAIKSVRGEIEGISKTVAKTREERFLSDLTAQNKSWRETYKNPDFQAMLGETEPFTGKTYGDLAQEANDALDAGRLAKIYNLFDSKSAAPAAKVEAAPEPKKEVKSKEDLIAPSGSAKATVSGGEKPDYIKADDIERFYQDSALNRYADRPKEKAEMEARINRAIANRWVIGG